MVSDSRLGLAPCGGSSPFGWPSAIEKADGQAVLAVNCAGPLPVQWTQRRNHRVAAQRPRCTSCYALVTRKRPAEILCFVGGTMKRRRRESFVVGEISPLPLRRPLWRLRGVETRIITTASSIPARPIRVARPWTIGPSPRESFCSGTSVRRQHAVCSACKAAW